MSVNIKTFRRVLRENGLALRVWFAEGVPGHGVEVLDIKTPGLGRGFLGRYIARISPSTSTKHDVRLSYCPEYKDKVKSAIARYDEIQGTTTSLQEQPLTE